jgi:acetate kinase
MSEWLLALNVGSSSVKFAAFPLSAGPELLRGSVSNIDSHPQLRLRRAGEASSATSCGAVVADLGTAIRHAIEVTFSCLDCSAVAGVGHRIVHGGAAFTSPALLTTETVEALHQLEGLAPLHQRAGLSAIDHVARRAPDVRQYGCFDTAFHATQPRLNRLLALPMELAERGVRRYGFHGLSYEHVAQVLTQRYGGVGRAVVAHLGAGASLCALKDGVSVATTMGMTPLSGIPMATRPGDLDPGAVLFLFEELGMSSAEVRNLLYRKSGLLGVSGESGDMRTLLTSARTQAADAVALFIECVQREIASLAGALGGIDTLVFTGGIGEQAPLVRARIGSACAWMGVTVDQALNDANAEEIHEAAGAVRVLVVRADEETVIAGHVRNALAGRQQVGAFSGGRAP